MSMYSLVPSTTPSISKAVFWALAVTTAILLLSAPIVAADVAAADTVRADDVAAADVDPADVAPKRPPPVGDCEAGHPACWVLHAALP